MEYRRLGGSGLKVSELSFGSWMTFGPSLDISGVKKCMRTAYDEGVNFFDNAEVYASGVSELLMGEALKDFRREDLVVSTKIFWGGSKPNQTGLNMKHLIEGTKNSLKRMQLDYVDLIFCHRPDPTTPIEETVRAMDIIVRSGLAFYWGTSEWSAKDVEKAYTIAQEIGATPPTMEQPQYNMFHRKKVEEEFAPLYAKYGLGTTIWSPLESGILTGKYNNGIPKGSRLDHFPDLKGNLSSEKLKVLQGLEKISIEIGCTMAQLAIGWCLKNPNVSTVITGATRPAQIIENMQSLRVKDILDEELMKRIESLLSSQLLN
ncbi:MAG: aldo/keto reductase [Chlamydiota bacterium]|nr:aldo/keto reductase [Chlamydiota bacterium]